MLPFKHPPKTPQKRPCVILLKIRPTMLNTKYPLILDWKAPKLNLALSRVEISNPADQDVSQQSWELWRTKMSTTVQGLHSELCFIPFLSINMNKTNTMTTHWNEGKVPSQQTKGQKDQTIASNTSWSNYIAHSKGKAKHTIKAIKNVSNINLSIEALRWTVTLQCTIQAGRKQKTKRKSIASSPIPKTHLVQSTLPRPEACSIWKRCALFCYGFQVERHVSSKRYTTGFQVHFLSLGGGVRAVTQSAAMQRMTFSAASLLFGCHSCNACVTQQVQCSTVSI